MSQDALSKPQFFSGSAHDFSPGQLLDPRQPHEANYRASHPRSFYMHTDPDVARVFDKSGKGRAYEVEPQGSYHKDYTMARQTAGEGAYMTSDPVKIVREI